MPACCSALRRASTVLSAWMNAWRVPYEAHTSVVGYASEGSACLRDLPTPAEAGASRRPGAASAKAGPTKHLEELQASARGGSTYLLFLYPFCPFIT